MKAHRVETTVSGDGSITVRELPFSEGDVVEVIVLPSRSETPVATERYPLRGTIRRYDAPFDPAVSPDDWEAV